MCVFIDINTQLTPHMSVLQPVTDTQLTDLYASLQVSNSQAILIIFPLVKKKVRKGINPLFKSSFDVNSYIAAHRHLNDSLFPKYYYF